MIELIKASAADLPVVCDLYRRVAEHMVGTGLTQWIWGNYPSEAVLRESIEAGELYLAREDDVIKAGVAVLIGRQDPEYEDLNWKLGLKYGLFHKLAVDPAYQGQGVGGRVLDRVETILTEAGCEALRCDTRKDNTRALSLYLRRGFAPVGGLTWDHAPGKAYIALEKPLTDACPMLPVRMHPAFRAGKLTPWGGSKLRTEYGKDIPCVPTGESLEVSCIPGLESTDDAGVKLPELISRYGERFAGRYARAAFPLLLKLIDASESLSVQVHPDDAYAGAHENGKLGKTEAWLILDAPENGELVYGIVPGTDTASLRAACEAGSAVSPLLRRVHVKPGDVCYIPAGCVHAIGAGIMLYEIQQSSDVTYRFYDWDRTDAQGNKRELHLDKALDVTDLSFRLDPVSADEGSCVRVLDKQFFTLDLMNVRGSVQLPPVRDLGLLTALTGGLKLCWDGASMDLSAGESLYLPAACPALTLSGTGRAALSMPN
ncbi:MAG: GNAT family N-acetyltransferase [Clostridia bacterium]|nr:GNAT family N-acetyltransferase [Clostridia bacterium]